MSGHVLVMAKAPLPGRVKTRLCPPCTGDEAATIAEAALADTLEAVAACGAGRRIIALDGPPGPWLPRGFDVIPQRGSGLAQRLANAWADAGGPGIQIGMDTPQVGAAGLDRLLALVRPETAVLGDALDGGWWVIGFADTDPNAVFDGMPMSTAATASIQLARLKALDLNVIAAPPLRDIDTVADLEAVCAASPWLRTAHTWASIRAARQVA